MGFPHGMFGGGGGGFGSGNIVIGAETRAIRGQVRNAMHGVKQELEQGAREVERTSSRWSGAFNLIGAAAKVGMFGIAAAVGAGVAAAISFESAWAGVRKTVDATPKELEALRQQFRDLAKEIPVSVNELAKIGETAGAMGIAKDSLLEFTKTVALIGQTTNVTTDSAATALGQLSNVLHLTEDDYGRFAATLVDLGNKGASTESQILDIASRAGSAAGLMKISAKDVLAYSSAIASLGIEVEAGGTSLQSFFLKSNALVGAGSGIQKAAKAAGISVDTFVGIVTKGGKPLTVLADKLGMTTKKLKELVTSRAGLEEMGAVAGMTGAAFAKAFEKDAAGALALFLEGLGKLKGADQQGVLKDLKFGDIRMTRTLLGLANGAGLLATNLNNADAAWKANTAATAEAEKRFETTSAQLGLLKNLLVDYLITLGDMALPAVKAVLVALRDDLPKAIKFLGSLWDTVLSPAVGKVGDAFGKLAVAIGKVFGDKSGVSNWGGIVKTVFTGIAAGAAQVLTVFSGIVTAVAWLLDNPLGQWVARLAAGAAVLLAITSGSKALIGGLKGASAGLARSLGLGRLVGPDTGKEDASSRALSKSAGDLSGSAKALEGAAGALKGAAAAETSGLGGGPVTGVNNNRILNAMPDTSGISMANLPVGNSVRLGSQEAAIQKAAYGRLNAAERAFQRGLAQPMGAAERAAFEGGAYNSGMNLFRNKADDVEKGIKKGATGIKGYASKALGAIGNLFWPAMVASIATEVLKAPLGDLISSNTSFKRVGAQMKEDFFGGLISLVQAWSIGSDSFVGHESTMTIGTMKFKTMSLAKLGVTSATFDKLEAPVGTIEHAQGVSESAGALSKDLAQKGMEGPRRWFERVQDQLPEDVRKAAEDIIAHGVKTTAQARAHTLTPEANAQLQALLSKQLTGQVVVLQQQTRTEFIKALTGSLKSLGLTTGQINSLSTGQLTQLGQIIQLNADGQYTFLTEFMTNKYLGAIASKPAAQTKLTGDQGARVAALQKAFGKDWESIVAQFATGATPKATKHNAAIAKKLEAMLGADYKALITDALQALHPIVGSDLANTPAKLMAGQLRVQEKNVEAAIKAFFTTVPENVSAAIDQMVAASGETDPAAVAALRTSLEQQWHANVQSALAAFTEQAAGVDPTILAKLKKKFGDDWVVAFRNGTGAITGKPVDKSVVAEMVKRFGPNWRAALQGFGQLLFAKEGGADALALKKALATAISAQIKGLTADDLSAPGKKPVTKKVEKADEAAVQKYLSSTVGQAALAAAAGPDATKAKEGFKTLGDALAKSIPDPASRNRFIGTLVALQKATQLPNLDSLSGFFGDTTPKAVGLMSVMASRFDELASAARRFLNATGGGGGAPSPGGGRSPNAKGGHAHGIVMDTSGTTELTVGEAGKERVAIPRNIRTMRLPPVAHAMAAFGGMGGPSGGAAPAAASASLTRHRADSRPPVGKKVEIHADKLQVFGKADEASLTARFGFLAQEGR